MMQRPMTGKTADRPLTASQAWGDENKKDLYDNDPQAAKEVPVMYGQDTDTPQAMESEVFDKDGSIRVQQRHKDKVQEQTGCWYSFKRAIRSIWMTKQTEDTKHDRELFIKTTLRELIIYLIFLIDLCILTFGMTDSTMYYFTNVMMNLFLNTDANPPAMQTFAGAAQISDFWAFAKGPMVDGLYWEQWPNNQNITDPDDLGYIFYENKLLGRPRLRMLKVKKNSCKVPDAFSTQIKECYDVYSSAVEEKAPFGPNNSFIYYSESALDGSSYWGSIATYSGAGYIASLARTKEVSLDIINTLMQNLWIDRGTRAIFLDFTVYNANINLFQVIKLVLEFPPTGGVIPSWSFRTVKLIRYVTAFDYFVLACEGIFCAFILYYLIEEAIEIHKHRCSYFGSFWNILDVVVIVIALCCIAFSAVRTVLVDNTLTKLLQDPHKYANFEFLSFSQGRYNDAVAIMVFFAWVKIFKYISFNKTMNQLSSTLSRCAKDVGGFAIMFFIFFFAYAQLGYLLFGTQVQDYSTFYDSTFTLLRTILGDFNFRALEQANRVLGPIFFITFVFFVFFVLLNMFLAIINDTYGEVKAELASQRNEFEISDYFKQNYYNLMRKMNLKKDRIVDIQHALHADSNNDKQVDFTEWRQQLKARGYADQEIEAMFAKYDMDGDRQLDSEEQKVMQNDLDGQKRALNEDTKRPNSSRSDSFRDFDESAGGPGELGHSRRHRRYGGSSGNVTFDEYNILSRRVDRMETSVGSIVNKIDAVLIKLEAMEKLKMRHQEEMTRIIDQIHRMDASDGEKREKMEELVKKELERFEQDSGHSTRPSTAVKT